MANKEKKVSAANTADTSPEEQKKVESVQESIDNQQKDLDPNFNNDHADHLEELQAQNEALKNEIEEIKFASINKPSLNLKELSLEELIDLEDSKISDLEEISKMKNFRKLELDKAAAIEAEKNDKRPIFTDDRGLQFRFKKSAPKTLNIDGKAYKLKDIIKDKEVMSELIYGNSNYVEQKYN